MKTYGLVKEKQLISIVLDEEGNPRLDTLAPNPKPEDWVAPEIVPLVKLDQPTYDVLTQYVEPKLVWHTDRVERDWDILAIPQQTLLQQASDAAKKAAKEAEAAKLQLLYADFIVQPEGFALATKEDDQNTFTRLMTLINVSNAPDSATMALYDSNGTLRSLTVGRIKEILVAYGLEIFSRWQTYKS
jgi:hypothetical protein